MDNVHPGAVLRLDFLIGDDIPVAEVAEGARIDADRLVALLDGRLGVDAETDLRLGRYFGVSEGFFLRLQNAYDLENAWKRESAELARIVPRAA